MPVTMQVGDLIVVKAWATDGEQAAVNRVWYSANVNVGTGGTDQQFADSIEAALAPVYKPALPTVGTWNGVQVQIYRNNVPFAVVKSTVNAGAGTGGALPMPRQVSGIIGLLTAQAGRKYRGRLYIPFPTTADDIGSGLPIAAYIAKLGLIAAQWIGSRSIGVGGNTTAVSPVIRHVPPDVGPPLNPTPITGSTTPQKFATQRKRGSYGRPNVSPI